MLQALFWLPFHFLLFLVVAYLVRSLVLLHQHWKLLGTACLQQSSMLVGLLLRFHTCNNLLNLQFPVETCKSSFLFFILYKNKGKGTAAIPLSGYYSVNTHNFLGILLKPKKLIGNKWLFCFISEFLSMRRD